MIKSIHIQNFRCFEDFQLEGFGRVNLIGGMNNSGKTILLEVLFIGLAPTPQLIIFLKETRYSNKNIWEAISRETVWDDLFYKQNKSKGIEIKANLKNNLELKMNINYSEISFQDMASINVAYSHNNVQYAETKISLEHKGEKEPKISEGDFKPELYRSNLMMLKGAYLSTNSSFAKDSRGLVSSYSKLELDNNAKYVLEGFKVIDNTIEEVKIVSLKEPSLYLRRKGESLMHIDLFGDAITKVASVIVFLIQNKNGIVSIDEIENGIHHTNQPKVWELIFKLANRFNVQVFATTHSKEMAEAFNKVALEGGFEEDAKYIEMARHYKTKRIIGTVLETNILKHKLEHNQPFRGE